MEKVLLISPNRVKASCNISDNVDEKYMASAIKEAQNVDLQSIIGTKMLDKLCELVEDGSITATTNTYYKELLDSAQYFLTYNVASRICVITSAKVSNLGVNQTSDSQNNVTAVSLNDVFRISEYYKQQGDFYGNRMKDYCLENYSHLPELDRDNISQMKSHLNTVESCGLVLGGRRGKGYTASLRDGINYDKH